MWATLWNAWYFNYKTVVHSDLDFVFGTDSRERAQRVNILHNAGVTEKSVNLFYKASWKTRSPIGASFPTPDYNTASSLYVEGIRDVKL